MKHYTDNKYGWLMNYEDDFIQGNKAWDEGRLEDALYHFEIAAKSGNYSATNTLGYFYEHGIGTEKCFDTAIFLYKKAAKHGDMCACANLGVVYCNKGLFRWAKFWLTRAISLGDADSALTLAKLYLEKGRNIQEAKKLLNIAARSEHLDVESKNEANALLTKIRSV
jgi:TPR repeat protein